MPAVGLSHEPQRFGMESPQRHDSELADLLSKAKASDEAALDALLVRLQGPVIAFLNKRLQDPRLGEFVEDVVSEVLIRVFKHHHKCQAQTTREVMSWVLSIAHNEALRLLSRRPLRYAVMLGDRDPAEMTSGGHGGTVRAQPAKPGTYEPVDRPAPRSPGLEAMLEVLETVEQAESPDRALILYLKLVEDRSWSEIGESLRISSSAAKRRFQRAQESMERSVLAGIEQLPVHKKKAALEFLQRSQVA